MAPVAEARARARAWAEISQSALVHNIHALQARLGAKTRLLAVVKADAYGHDIGLVAPICCAQGIRDYGVATVDEGIALRTLLSPDADIYLLAAPLPADAFAIAAHRLVALVGDLDMACALSQAAQAQHIILPLHLDMDTGIGRAGAQATAARALLAQMQALPGVQVAGIATHFADADDNPPDARAQNTLFQQTLCALGIDTDGLLIHAGNSPALLALGGAALYDLVRPGLLLYGIEPAPGLFTASQDTDTALLSLQPVLSLRARVLVCRTLPGGATISYGRTFTVPPGGGTYATVGIGYGDGFPRRLGGGAGHVLLRGARAPIVGRVCMDQLVVDVSHLPEVAAGEAATLIGTDGAESITIGQMAAIIGTTPHEISTCLTARVPRVLAE